VAESPELKRPSRWPKVLLVGVGTLALLLAIAYFALNRAFPPQRLAALLSDQVSQASGRDFAVRGPLSIRLLPRLAVVAEELVLGNAPWGSRQDMLRVDKAAFELEIWPLLQGHVQIEDVTLDGVDLLLETDRAGNGNWQLKGRGPPTAPAGDGPSALSSFDLAQLHLQRSVITYRDGRSGVSRTLTLAGLDVEREGTHAQLAAQFVFQRQPFELKGSVGALDGLLANVSAWPFDLQLSTEGALLSAKGELKPGEAPRAVAADLRATLTKATALTPWLADVSAVPLPVELQSSLQVGAGELRFDALQLSLAEQRLTGRLTVQNGSPWKLDGQLASDSIDLARWLPKSATGSAAGSTPRRWLFADTPLPFDALPQLPATLALKVQRLRLPDLPELSALSTTLRNAPGSLKADNLSFAMAGGRIDAHLALATGGKAAPRLSLRLDAKDLSVDALAAAAGGQGYARGGRAQMHVRLDMSGSSPRALAAGANGQVLFELAGTTLRGGNSPIGPNLLPQLLQAITLQHDVPKQTVVQCAVLRLPLNNGVALIDRSIAIETDQLNISATGEVRFSDETLQLAFKPHAKGLGINTASLASLVLLKGPLLDPKFSLDAKGVAGIALSIGAAGATGGLSLLGQRLLHQAADPQPCRFAATGKAAATAAPPAPTAAPNIKTPPLEKALPELFRRIFK
jgi:uncharacterized protein involved in outer membrane biogenesis